jgi:thiol-disulfide isomerase/thioredoxin
MCHCRWQFEFVAWFLNNFFAPDDLVFKDQQMTATILQRIDRLVKLILIFVVLTFMTSCSAQTGEVPLQKCTNDFQRAIENVKSDSLFDEKINELRNCIVGKSFPSFKAITLNNEIHTKTDYAGKVVLINLWFTSCAPCVAEIPMLNELHHEYTGKNFKLISFATDNQQVLYQFLEKRPVAYDIFPDSRKLIDSTFKMTFVYPTNILLNKKGQIVEVKFGSALDEANLRIFKKEFKEIIDKELKN